ncbi:Sugar phosphate isomerase/epimerase [Sporobacter termitidis DSM 10068]|uniref:Sugar phosphate isomerase/epimerase n=1 Tax=Sporobacter termitidis DSM 10068 TaxID=1123282 RepID=A0A1M5X3J2_9FIRM|nr:TIM barrel protein [Sporobacter termitidis]SHH94390.1 Sugar phosphate isomerase/epimerase [Sporobacter termitidis DSM 10068]
MNDKNISNRVYLSTVAGDAAPVAAEYGLGLELAEFCTASNMDADFNEWDAVAREKMKSADRLVLHAAFNELCPAAIDPLVLDIAKRRYRQAYELAAGYGIRRIVAHSGYVPFVYFKQYFVDRSVEFWQEFLSDKPADLTVVLENVLEDEPFMLIDVVKGVGDPRLRLCLDVGHANITKKDVTMEEWARAVVPYLGHAHLHNNRGWPDSHDPLFDGDMDLEALLHILAGGAPDATLTLEIRDSCRSSVEWLANKGFLDR